jgi:hypothetical protein
MSLKNVVVCNLDRDPIYTWMTAGLMSRFLSPYDHLQCQIAHERKPCNHVMYFLCDRANKATSALSVCGLTK